MPENFDEHSVQELLALGPEGHRGQVLSPLLSVTGASLVSTPERHKGETYLHACIIYFILIIIREHGDNCVSTSQWPLVLIHVFIA